MSIEHRQLTGCIGAEIEADVAALLQPGIGEQLRCLLVERGVLLFRELNPTDEQQLAIADQIGSVRREGDHGIYKITLDKRANARADYLKGSFLWHIDGTHDNVPPFATMLTGRVLSDVGGQTEFANSYAAYEALPAAMREKIADLRVVHSVELSMRRAGVPATEENVANWRSHPLKTHRLVWHHESGRKSLVIGSHAARIENMDEKEGQALLDELLAWATRPEFVYRHEWRPGDMLVWDNTGVLHRAEPYPLDSKRVMHRCTLQGEEAFS